MMHPCPVSQKCYDRFMDPSAVAARARCLAGLSTRQVGALADLAPSTVARVEQAKVDPSVSTLDAILDACGYRLEVRLEPVVDLDAVRAARRILEPSLDLAETERSALLESRWLAAGLLSGAPKTVAERVAGTAGLRARLFGRPGAIRFRAGDWRKVLRALEAAEVGWALTGGRAAASYTGVATTDWTAVYVEDVEAAIEAADLEPLPDDTGGANFALIPFDDVTVAGVQIFDGGARLAAFWQVVIDCFAGNGRMPDQAEAMIARLASLPVPR